MSDSKNNKAQSSNNYDAIAVHNMMRTEEGRSFIWAHLQSCNVFENMFHPDPIQHAYKAGVREAGLRLFRDIRSHEPEFCIQMMKENFNG